jgi:hypothetical protein
MPVDPGTTLPIFQGMLAANAVIGPGSGQLAAGLANGLFQYLSASVTVLSIDAGTLGAGTGVGFGLILPPSVILGVLSPMMAGHLILGPFAPSTANAIAMAVSLSLAGASVQTVNAGVGIGAGKVQLVPTGTGGAVFAAAMTAAGLTGPMASALGDAVGMSLDTVIAAVIGVVVIAGPPNILPGAGTGVGKIT